MSIYDYHYDPTNCTTNEASGIGSSKYASTTKSHNSGDAFYCTELSLKQQLCEIALSMASLCNIGNSCYMNSVIYTLRFTPLFLHNLHHLVSDFTQIVNRKDTQIKLKSASLGRNVSTLQCQNSRSYSSKDLVSLGSSSPSSSPAYEIIKTTQQSAVEKLHELFKSLTSNEIGDSIEPHQSDTFLKAIQEVNPIFEGNQQQDAHEFLMCILDSIRESCQSLSKVINDYPEIVVGGFAAETPERTAVKPPVNIPSANERKPASWFKRRKEEKTKLIATDSPSKESNAVQLQSTKEASSAPDAASDKNSCATAFAEPLLISKQTIQEKIKALGLDFFSEDFEGVTASSIQCLECETTTEQKETMIDLAVPITENMETHELNDTFIQNLCITHERFQGDNKFRCENCMGLTEAIRKITYPKLPRLLTIQLKRFSGGMEKINSYIPTPFTLQCFCSECISDYGKSREHEYKLYSVITHVGSTLQAGHYIAYTCSLNQDSIYIDCVKNSSRKDVQLLGQPAVAALSSSSSSEDSINRQNSFSATASTVNSSTVVNVMKKIGLGRKKSSSNHIDMSKNMKVNGIKSMVNGTDGGTLASNADSASTNPPKTLCPGNSCCGIKMKTPSPQSNQYSNGSDTNLSNGNGTTNDTDHSRKCNALNAYNDQYYGGNANNIGDSGNGNYVGPHKLRNEPIWYMCDDDKIKAIPQHEFREMLLPKKNMITPYLLFYARNDILGSH